MVQHGARMGATRMAMVVILAGAGLVGGCVSQKSYDELTDANRATTEGLQRQMSDAQQARAELAIERGLREKAEAENAAMRDRLAGTDSQYADLLRRLDAAQVMALDPETDRLLSELAANYPDLVKYDSTLGMLRFTADLTFDSGSDVVRDAAKASLAALAKVLTGASAAAYEVRIEGHTDSQRISPDTARRHPTNVHLSCHRAISVRRELVTLGVPAGRMVAAGWGEERPLIANSATGNTPQNRRVEIFLTRGRPGSNAAASGSVGIDREAPPARPAEPIK